MACSETCRWLRESQRSERVEWHRAIPGRGKVRIAAACHGTFAFSSFAMLSKTAPDGYGLRCRATDLSHRVKKSYEKMLLPFEQVSTGCLDDALYSAAELLLHMLSCPQDKAV